MREKQTGEDKVTTLKKNVAEEKINSKKVSENIRLSD